MISIESTNNAETKTMDGVRYTRLDSGEINVPRRACSMLQFRSKSLFILLCMSGLTFIVYLMISQSKWPLSETSIHQERKQFEPRGKRLILLWTGWWHIKNWNGLLNRLNSKCSCEFTNNRQLLEQASVLVFHGSDTEKKDLPRRIHNQPWVWYTLESPHFIYQNIKSIENQMDCYATHRKDSDVYLPYGRTFPIPMEPNKSVEIDFESRNKSIAWLVSRCKTPSKREEYVKELQNFTNVDVYGGCGKSCDKLKNVQRSEKDPCHTLLKEYKFYLAFENSICKDYFTEKLVYALESGLIPIVMGLANYTRDFPPNSVINVFDFQSPKDLAEYVEKVSTDEKLYYSHHEWRKNFTINSSDSINSIDEHLCKICEEINQECGRRNQSMVEWWEKEAHCTTWQKYLTQLNKARH